MSTNVVRPTTTSGSGRPSRFLGLAAAGLAVVIALGVVFAVNQGNEVTVVAPAHPMVSDAHRAKAEILAERAAAAAVSPGANIEQYKLEQAGAIGGTQSPGANIEKYRLEQASAVAVTQSPGANIERYKLDMGVIGVEPTSTFNTEQYWMDVQQAERAREAWSFQMERAPSAERSQKAWSDYIEGLTDWFSGNIGSAQATP